MLQRLYQLFLLFKEYVVFVLLVILSTILLSLNDNSQIHRIRSIAVGAIGALQHATSAVPNIFSLQKENEVLRRMNVTLADEVNQLREARLQNLRLKAMLALKETSSIRLVAATVVGKNMTLLRNTLTLNVGENDGVDIGMPLVTGEGLVGRIISRSGGYSVAQIVLNVDFRASAKVQRSRVDGIVAWDGKTLLLKNVVKSMDVKPGDAVMTSEYSNIFPPGIKISVIAAVSEIPGELFKRVEMVPTVDFVRLQEVFVMKTLPSLEKVSIENPR